MKCPSNTFSQIRRTRRCTAGKLQKLVVGDRVFSGDKVPDGFFSSIKDLKMRNVDDLYKSGHFQDIEMDYENILKLCEESRPIKPITEKEALDLLQRMKNDVTDLYSITPRHYLYAGPAGCHHFFLLLSSFLDDVKNTTIHEINASYAVVLFKGHGKDKTSSRSYRTISTCPLVAKALDLYIRDQYIKIWNENQAETQFQGEGSSHELSALLLTECIQYSKYVKKLPTFVLYLDAKSAFDVILREILIKNLYSIQNIDQSLLYINNRLEHRSTFVDWNGVLMGPIDDERGLEQGGINSSDLYKIYAREHLDLAQQSCLGVQMHDVTISGIGMADDTALVSNNIHNLAYLLKLSLSFSDKYHGEICAEKTQLQVYWPNRTPGDLDIDFIEETNPILIDGKKIPFSTVADHVGIVRSTSGNREAILARICAHKNAVASILSTGMARGHRGNPAVGIKVHCLYGVPVLLSGIAALVLSSSDVNLIEGHYKATLSNLMRLHAKTPRSVVYFLAGSLPGVALIHLRQMSLFGMLTRLPGSILHKIACNTFSSGNIPKTSWFWQIRKICMNYALPHPLELLQSSPTNFSCSSPTNFS